MNDDILTQPKTEKDDRIGEFGNDEKMAESENESDEEIETEEIMTFDTVKERDTTIKVTSQKLTKKNEKKDHKNENKYTYDVVF